jgi:ABC transporter substrate binding protein
MTIDIGGRQFISALGSVAATWPLATRAQQPAMPVVAFLGVGSPDTMEGRVSAFRKGLSETGYAEGQNVLVEYHWLEGQYERLTAVLSDLIKRRVAVIAIPGGTPISLAAKSATSTIPIVFGVAENPVTLGLVTSLAKPGGNGGRDDFRWLVAQPTVHGADLGRLNHSLLQPPAGGDIKVHVEFLEARRRPAGRGEHLGHVVSIGKGEHSGSVRDRLRPRRQVLRGCSHRHLHPRIFGQRAPARERHARIRSGSAAHIGERRHPIAEEHHSEGRDQQIVFVQLGRGGIGLPPIDIGDAGGARAPFTLSKHRS